MKILFLLLYSLYSFNLYSQIITTFAGGGGSGLGDGGLATSANISNPNGSCFDKNNNFYVASNLSGNRIRLVKTDGFISTIAGNGIAGFSGDGGLATSSQLKQPASVAVDSSGNIYIADAGNHRIRKVDKLTGNIYTIAGNGIGGYNGDGGLATNASINNPQDVCTDNRGNIYIADYNNGRIRKVNSDGIITSIAGNGIFGYSGDGSRADTSRIGGVWGLCIDESRNLFLSDAFNSRVFKIDSNGIIHTAAGTDNGYLYNGENRPATLVNIHPTRIAVDKFGNLIIGDHLNYRVWHVDKDGIIKTIAGNGIAGSYGDNGNATSASFNYASGIALDSCGNIYISEANKGIRKVDVGKCNYLFTNIISQNKCIYPNPFSNILNIVTGEPIFSVVIADVFGGVVKREIFTNKPYQVSVILCSQPPGIYMVRVNDVWMGKVVKE